MQERLDYGNKYEPRQNEYQDDLDWRVAEYQSYHVPDIEDPYDEYEDEGDFDEGDFGEDHEDDFAQDDAADYQEQHEPGDTAGADYAATRFSALLRRGRGLIEGEKWRPPYQRGPFMPVFVRLKDVQRRKDLEGKGRAPSADEILDEESTRLLSVNPPPREKLE